MQNEVNNLKQAIIDKLANLKNNDEFFDDKKSGYENALDSLNEVEDYLEGLQVLSDNFYDVIRTNFEHNGKKYETKARLYKSDERIDNLQIKEKGKHWSSKIEKEIRWELEVIAEKIFKKHFVSWTD